MEVHLPAKRRKENRLDWSSETARGPLSFRIGLGKKTLMLHFTGKKVQVQIPLTIPWGVPVDETIRGWSLWMIHGSRIRDRINTKNLVFGLRADWKNPSPKFFRWVQDTTYIPHALIFLIPSASGFCMWVRVCQKLPSSHKGISTTLMAFTLGPA